MATNQPIPFKEHSSGPARADGEDPQVPGKAAAGEARPPGEVGGHTVQPWEQDRSTATASTPSGTSSKDVPPPQLGAAEARAPGGEPGMATTAAPYNTPSAKEAEPAREPADAALAKAGGDGDEDEEGEGEDGVAAEHGGARGMRPSRPPVYSPQQGHEPAPRPPPGHVPGAPMTEGDRLVEAITKAIAENIGKAFHQSVAQAVREVLPLSGRSVDQGKPTNGSSLRAAPGPSGMGKVGTPSAPAKPSFPHAATAAGTAQGKVPSAKAAGRAASSAPPAAKPQEAKPATHVDPSAQSQLGGPKPSQFGGTIEAPDQDAIEKAKRADGRPAADAADGEKRDGSLV